MGFGSWGMQGPSPAKCMTRVLHRTQTEPISKTFGGESILEMRPTELRRMWRHLHGRDGVRGDHLARLCCVPKWLWRMFVSVISTVMPELVIRTMRKYHSSAVRGLNHWTDIQ